MSKGQKGLIVAVSFCALILAFVFAWFMQTVEDAKTPISPNDRQAVPLGADAPGTNVDNDSPGAADDPDSEENYDKIYEESKKKQKGLGSLRK